MSKLNFDKEIFDLDIWIEQLKIGEPLNEIQMKQLCKKVIFLNKYNNKIISIQIGQRNFK